MALKKQFKEEHMEEKVVDLTAYRIEKSLKDNGFVLKKDGNKKVKILLKVKSLET